MFMKPMFVWNQNKKPLSSCGNVIYLKHGDVDMLEKDLMLQNPLRLIGYETEEILPKGGFGAVLARAGVGKTAFLVQIALHSLLRGRNVLHISLDDPVGKVGVWYEEVFRNIFNQHQIQQRDQLWEAALRHRFIMTFRVEGFSVPKLQERLTDLTEQAIFCPQMILIDGLPFDETVKKPLSDLKSLARDHAMQVWFAVQTHRHEKSRPQGMPAPLSQVSHLFEVAVELQPVENQIHVKALRGATTPSDHSPLLLDPSTMVIT
jgi:hypothetical protein